MKKVKWMLVAVFMTALLSFASEDSYAIHTKIDQYITATNGCRVHLTGSVDWGLGGISHYDVTATSPCFDGPLHFKGLVVPEADPEGDGDTNQDSFTFESYDDAGDAIPDDSPIVQEQVFEYVLEYIQENPDGDE